MSLATEKNGKAEIGVSTAKKIHFEHAFERLFLTAFKVLHLPLFFGLLISMIVIVYMFVEELAQLLKPLWEVHAELHSDGVILGILGLLDLVMIGNLVMLMAVSGYENHVSKMDFRQDGESGFKAVGLGTLKTKLAASIVGITTIKLLAVFLSPDTLEPSRMTWMIGIHATIVITMVLLGLVDRYLIAHSQSH